MKIKTDTKINVDSEVKKKIANMICRMIKSARSAHEDIYKRAERCENQYNQVTKYMAENKVCNTPWKGAADYFVAMSEWTVDAVFARVMTLFSQRPYMSAKALTGDSVQNKENVEDFNDMILVEEVKLQENIAYFLKQAIKIPLAICKFTWVSEFESMIVKDKAFVFTSQEGKEEYLLPDDLELESNIAKLVSKGFTPQEEKKDVWVKKDIEVKDGANLKYIKFDDYVWAEKTLKGKKPYFEGDRIYLTLNEMQMQVRNEKFDKDAVGTIATKIKELSTSGDAISGEVEKRSKPIECYNIFCRLPFNAQNEIDFDDDEAIEQEVELIVAYKEEEILMIQHWEYERYPTIDRVYLRLSFDETDDFEGRSLLEKLYMNQKYMNQMANTIINNAWLAMQKVFVKKRDVKTVDWERPEIFPGAILEEDMTGDIRVLEMGDVKSIGLELQKMQLDFSERISNISIMQTGANRTQGQKTLGEIEATIREGNKGLNKYMQACVSILIKIVQWNTAYYKERMPANLERRLSNNGQPIFPTEQNLEIYKNKNKSLYWQPNDLYGKFDWEWENTVSSGSRELQIAIANDLMKELAPHPMIAQNLMATWQMLKLSFEARGIKNWQDYLPTKEKILEEMQAKQKEYAQENKQKELMKVPSVEARVQQKLQQMNQVQQ